MTCKPMNSFLDSSIKDELRNVVNERLNTFTSEDYRTSYNLLSAVLARLDSAVDYVNQHSELPETKEDFICFLVFACFIVDAHKNLYPAFELKENFVDFTCFRSAQQDYQICVKDEDIITDDGFFEYLRAVAFAHSYNTNRHLKAILGDQVSPWVTVQKPLFPSMYPEESVGIRVYTTKKIGSRNSVGIYFSFKDLKQYLQITYKRIEAVTKKIIKTIPVDSEETSEVLS